MLSGTIRTLSSFLRSPHHTDLLSRYRTEGLGEGKPNVAYPDGFQGNYIPAHGPAIAKLIEDRVEGRV